MNDRLWNLIHWRERRRIRRRVLARVLSAIDAESGSLLSEQQLRDLADLNDGKLWT